MGDERILGTLDQFCAAFFHVPKGESEENNAREYVCLYQKKCISAQEAKKSINKAEEFARKAEQFATNIEKQTDANTLLKEASDNFIAEAHGFAKQADKHIDKLETCAKNIEQIVPKLAKKGKSVKKVKQAAEEATKLAEIARNSPKGWDTQPKTGVAFVKFENHRRKILYEARYTYCASRNMHAENFFKKDIKNGVFKELVQDNPKGSITLYLTLQLSNCPAGTGTDHSFSVTLKEIVPILKDKQEIKLCIKAARMNKSQRPDSDDPNNALEVNENEIKELMDLGVKFSGMTQDDWDYLFTLTKDSNDCKHLGQEVESIFRRIEK